MKVSRLSACVALAFATSAPVCVLAASTPYAGTPAALPGTIRAVNFDKGGEGAGYHDLTAANVGGQYRPSEAVDIYASTDSASGGYEIEYFQTGEWTAYTVNVAASANYDIAIRASNNYSSNAAFHIEVDGVNVTGSIKVPMTGAWTTYQSVGKPSIALSAGQHVIKLVADAQYFNVSAITVTASATQASAGTTSAVASAPSYAGTPYSGSPVALPLAFPAVNFDKGGQGVAYRDLTAGNQGGLYRPGEDVDIFASTDSAGGPYQVASIQTGEWMNYSVNVPASGNYDLSVHVANNYTASVALHIEVDGANVTGSLKVPVTGSWTTFQWVGKTGVPLTAGKHVLKVVSDQQYFNLSAISVLASAGTAASPGATAPAPAGYAGTPYGGTPVTVPATIMAANFDKGGQGVAYKDLTSGNSGGLYRTSEDVDITSSTDSAGGGYAIGSFQTGEWLNYSINVPSAGNYDLGIRAATNYAAPTAFHIEVDGSNVTGTVPVPITGDWTTYQWFGKSAVPLSAGKHVLKVVADAQYFNMSAVSIAASGGSVTTGSTAAATPSAPSAPATLPSSLLFWSGFEGNLAVGLPYGCWGNGCWQDLTGTDSSTGFAWPPKVSGGQGQFQTLTNPTAGAPADPTNIGNYMSNQLVTVTGHKGNATRALLSTITQSGCCGTSSQDAQNGSTQDPYQILPAADVPEMYISQWIMLQPDLAQKMSANTWRDLFEWKTTDTDYRVQLAIKSNNGSLYWAAIGDGYVPAFTEYWRVNNTTVPVPVGQWFKLEIYWKRGSGTSGRVWMAVNGQVIADQRANNIGPNGSPIDRIMMSQLYSGSGYSIYQWLDDVQIWSTFPTAASGNAWYDPPYGSH